MHKNILKCSKQQTYYIEFIDYLSKQSDKKITKKMIRDNQLS